MPGIAVQPAAAPSPAAEPEAGGTSNPNWPALSPEQFGIVLNKPPQQPDLPPRSGRDGGLAVPEA
jgi:hypothetical protein